MPNSERHPLVEAELVEAELIEESPAIMNSTRAPMLERLLSKRALDVMMMSGGALLTTGFAAWLWSIGVFAHPIVLASTVGGLNLGLIALGLWLWLQTQHKVAGRSLLLLGSLILPLNLWLYDSQGLISLAEGGPLWLPALIMTSLYALILRVTRDSIFVFTLVGGIVLTGLLFVLSATGSIVLTTLPLATFLVAVGISCVLLDFRFAADKGDFSRDNFGLAFHRCGIAVLFAASGWLALGQFASLLNTAWLSTRFHFQLSSLTDTVSAELWALALSIAVAATSIRVSMTSRRHVIVSALSIATAMWAIVNAFLLLNITITFNLGLLLVTLMLIAGNLYRQFTLPNDSRSSYFEWSAICCTTLLALTFLRLNLGIFLNKTLVVEWSHIGLLITNSLAILTLPGVWTSDSKSRWLALGTSGVAWGNALVLLRLEQLNVDTVIAVSTILPIFLTALCCWIAKPDLSDRFAVAAFASAATSFVFWALLLPIYKLAMFVSVASMILVAILAFVFLTLSLTTGRKRHLAFAITLAVCFAIQVMTRFQLVNAFLMTSFLTSLGIKLVLTRLIAQKSQRLAWLNNQHLQNAGNILIGLGATGSVLFTGFELISGGASLSHLGLLLAQLVGLAIAAAATQVSAWRQFFLVVSAAMVACLGCVVCEISTLSVWQKLEIVSLALGSILVGVGYWGWSREKGVRDQTVSFNLFAGSMLLIIPLMAGLIIDRVSVDATIGMARYVHEIGAILVALLLLGSGILTQIRATTLSGAALLTTFVISNILIIDLPDQLQQTSVLMMVGGAAFFGTAVILSVYRERLMQLPDRIRKGKGVFKVLNWR